MMMRLGSVWCRSANRAGVPLLRVARPFGVDGGKKVYSQEKREKFSAILRDQDETKEEGVHEENVAVVDFEKGANFSESEVPAGLSSGQPWRVLALWTNLLRRAWATRR